MAPKNDVVEVRIIGELCPPMVDQILTVLSKHPREIDLMVCGPGGEFPLSLAIIDLLDEAKRKGVVVATYALGEVASGAAMICAAGTKGHRFAYPSVTYGLHEPYIVDAVEDPAAAAACRVESRIMQDIFYSVLTRYAPSGSWRYMLGQKSMLWLTAPQAIQYGLCDHILD